MLEVEHLCFSYGKRDVLRGVDLRAEPGELVFVLGANGAGKTTLFRCILGLLPGYQGRIRVDGGDVSSLTPRALAKKIAYIPQTSHMVFPYTALELVLMGTNHRLGLFSAPGRRERAIALEALAELGIADYAHRSFAELSGGEQQLVLAARALAQQARLLLMDEPTSSLDFGNQVRVLERVSALTLRGYTVLLSCHNPQHAMLYAQRVVALHDGRVAADGPPDQALDEALMRKLYGVPARFVRTGDGVLIAPVRKSIVLWTPDMVRFMADAIRVNGSCAAMAAALSQVLPPGARVCDARWWRPICPPRPSAIWRHSPCLPTWSPGGAMCWPTHRTSPTTLWCSASSAARMRSSPPPGGSVPARWRCSNAAAGITAFPGGRTTPGRALRSCAGSWRRRASPTRAGF